MDKISTTSYLTDYILSDHTVADMTYWAATENVLLLAPSPQLINFLIARGWACTSWHLTDPTAITDWAVMQKGQWHPNRVLQDLLEDFNTSYNEGRTLNDQRYDEILSLWAALQDKTEDELNSIEDDEDSFEALVTAIFTSISSDFTSYETDSDNRFDSWGNSLREIVDDDADALLASKEANMRARGLYNTTLWDAIEVGIERERTDADVNVEDKILLRQQELDDRLYTAQTQMRDRLVAARSRLMNLLHDQATARTSLRNRVVEAINAFAERRTDEYPSFLEPMNAALNIAVSQNSQGWT